MIRNIFLGIVSTLMISGCLTTRSELREQEQKQVLQEQVTTLQQTRAQEQVRQQEYDEQIRTMSGRLDQVERRLSGFQETLAQLQGAIGRGHDESGQKFKAVEEALVKLDGQAAALAQEVEGLKKPKTSAKAEPAGGKSTMQEADEAFDAKDWKGAIVLYQKYRDRNPKGKKYAEATVRIGQCFKELGMKSEAKSFFEEVTDKYPTTPEAKKAKSLLKGLK